MPTYTVKKGDNLSAIAKQHGVKISDISGYSSGNPNLIRPGEVLNIGYVEKAAPTNENQEQPASDLSSLNAANASTSPLGNLRLALRDAMNEAGRRRMETSFGMVSPLAEGLAPGSMGSVVDLIRGGVKTSTESIFKDITDQIEKTKDAQEKEKLRVQELRLKYGSAIPASVTSLDEAINLVSPLVDEERRLDLKKKKSDQAVDDDIESWAKDVAEGVRKITDVPSAIRTKVNARASEIMNNLESEAKEEFKNNITFKIDNKISDYEAERSDVMSDETLTVAERREMLDYIDTLEMDAKARKKGQKNIKNPSAPSSSGNSTRSFDQFGGGQFNPTPTPGGGSKPAGSRFKI